MNIIRRRLMLAIAISAALLTACAHAPTGTVSYSPIVFVHGNGDTAALRFQQPKRSPSLNASPYLRYSGKRIESSLKGAYFGV